MRRYLDIDIARQLKSAVASSGWSRRCTTQSAQARYDLATTRNAAQAFEARGRQSCVSGLGRS